MLKSGIYQIKCKKNNKIYVGQSVNIARRWKQHQKDLADNDHSNSLLQRDYNRYGKNNFVFSIIETCPKYKLDARESIWIARRGNYNAKRPDIPLWAATEEFIYQSFIWTCAIVAILAVVIIIIF